jgi:hypothetical protein
MQNQSVTFDELESKTTTDGTFELSASATSGLAVTYTSSNPNVATIAGTTVAIKGAGTTSIIAEQTGGINYHPSPSIARTLTVTMIVATEEPLELGTLPYPNPASNDFIIELDYTGGTTESLQLFDMIGRSRFINAEKLEGKKYKCQINEVPPGLYFLAIPNTDKSWSIMISR